MSSPAVAAASASEAAVAFARGAGVDVPSDAELKAAVTDTPTTSQAMILSGETCTRLRLGHANALLEAGRYEDAVTTARGVADASRKHAGRTHVRACISVSHRTLRAQLWQRCSPPRSRASSTWAGSCMGTVRGGSAWCMSRAAPLGSWRRGDVS